jgi:hypothetical protein
MLDLEDQRRRDVAVAQKVPFLAGNLPTGCKDMVGDGGPHVGWHSFSLGDVKRAPIGAEQHISDIAASASEISPG